MKEVNSVNTEIRVDGVAGLKKRRMKPIYIAFLIFTLIASGAFGIEDMLPKSGPGMTLILLVVMAIIWAHPLSQVVSELTALIPAEGGIYVWVKEALGEFWGFCTGWWQTASIYCGSAAYVVLIVNYASQFIPALTDPTIAFLVKLGIVCLFVVINLMGIKEVGIVSTILSVCILLGFTAVTVVGLANWQYNPMDPVLAEGSSILDTLGGSIAIVIWMYCGFEAVSTVAGELENPEDIPKGFKMAMPIIVISYILPTLAGIVSVGDWQNWGTDGIGYGNVLGEYLGYGWGIGFLVIAIIGQAAIFNSYIAVGSRGFFVLADDKLCPKFLVRVSQKRGVPIFAVLVLGAFTAIMMNFDFTALLVIVGPLALMVYVILGVAAMILRKKYPVEERDCWYIKGSDIKFKLFACVPIIIAIIAMLVNGMEYFMFGFISILSALIAYVIIKPIYGGLYKLDPVKNPINIKTRMAKGDIARFGAFLLAVGLYAVLGSCFMIWYEDPAYYLETYGTGLLSNFRLMIKIVMIGGGIAAVLGLTMIGVGKKKDPSSAPADVSKVKA